MILTLGQTSEEIVVTLNEKRTLTSGYYLFYFIHFTTKQIVTKIYNFTEDNSNYQDRFNLFDINTNVVFASKPTGQWLYRIYEQASSTNILPTGTEVERGELLLNPAVDFSYTNYNEATTFKAYNG